MLGSIFSGLAIDAYELVGRTTSSGEIITMADVANNFLRHTLTPALVAGAVGFALGRELR